MNLSRDPCTRMFACGTCTVAALMLFASHAFAMTPRLIRVESGVVEGTVEDDLTIYRGIPFAAPPVGDLRWRAPQPAPKWNGVRTASEYGRACMQSNPAISNLPAPGEDCLLLNVWTPATRALSSQQGDGRTGSRSDLRDETELVHATSGL